MTETERITNEVMDRHQTGSPMTLNGRTNGLSVSGNVLTVTHTDGEYVHANILGEGPNVSELRNDDGIAFFTGIRNMLAFEVLAGLVIWGLWELHHPIMFLAHWMVAHAR